MSRIVVIGAQVPDYSYDSSMGIRVGNIIAKMMKKGDVLITGGVEGVGLDVFTGFGLTPSKGTFECIIPKQTQSIGKNKEVINTPYHLPEAYQIVSKLTKKTIQVISAGNNMAERREFLAKSVDIAIVMNGGIGTLHEAVMLLQNGIPVIAIPRTGGIAELLSAYIYNDIEYIDVFFAAVRQNPPKIKNLGLIDITTFSNLEETLQGAFQIVS
jgi:predicted Rossmann-fold nucleotide-binding protein